MLPFYWKMELNPQIQEVVISEEVNIITNTNDSITTTCYNLPSELLTGTNELYPISLYKLAKEQGFPDDYLEKIKKMTTITSNK